LRFLLFIISIFNRESLVQVIVLGKQIPICRTNLPFRGGVAEGDGGVVESNPSVGCADSPVCGSRWMSSATARLRPPPTAAHTAPALASATGGGQARGPYRGACNPSVGCADSPVCGSRWMSSATARLRPPPTAAHTAPALASATGGGQARGPYRGACNPSVGYADSSPTGELLGR